MRRVNIVLALGAALSLCAGLSANGKPGHAGSMAAGHVGPHVNGHGIAGHGAAGHSMPVIPPINSLMPGSHNPVVLPAWKSSAGRTGMGFAVGTARDRLLEGDPGVTVVSSGVGDKSEDASQPTVNNGTSTNRQHLLGTVVAVRQGAEGAGGTIQLRLPRVELPAINDKQPDQPNQDVTVHVSDTTSIHASGQKGRASLADVHLGQTVRVGWNGRLIHEVEILAMSGSR